MRFGYGFHGQKILGRILKDQRSNAALRRDARQISQTVCLDIDSRGIAEPVRSHSKLWQGLFDNPSMTSRTLEPDGFVGNAAAELLKHRFFPRTDSAVVAQIPHQLAKILDVNRWFHCWQWQKAIVSYWQPIH